MLNNIEVDDFPSFETPEWIVSRDLPDQPSHLGRHWWSPTLRRDLHLQNILKLARCQRKIVFGFTTHRTSFHLEKVFISNTQVGLKAGVQRSFGVMPFSCWG
jgi:hypothetical protein